MGEIPYLPLEWTTWNRTTELLQKTSDRKAWRKLVHSMADPRLEGGKEEEYRCI